MSKFLLLLRTDTVVQLAMRLLFSNKCIGQIDNDIAHRTPCTFHTTIVHRGINRKGVPIEIGILVVVRLDDWCDDTGMYRTVRSANPTYREHESTRIDQVVDPITCDSETRFKHLSGTQTPVWDSNACLGLKRPE
jgi:hypothetical protein